MPIPAKNKIKCRCQGCKTEVFLRPHRVKKFKYCSNQCKWNAKKKRIPYNKIPLERRSFTKCNNPFCQKGRYLLPSDVRLHRYKYCSITCRNYVKSQQFILDTEIFKEKQVKEIKRNIWFLSK